MNPDPTIPNLIAFLRERVALREVVLLHLRQRRDERSQHFDAKIDAAPIAARRALSDQWSRERHQIEISIAAADAERLAYLHVLKRLTGDE